MIIVCPACQSRYKFDESKLGERPKAKTRCAKCGSTIEIENPLLAAMTLPPGTRPPVPAPAPTPPAPPSEPEPGTETSRRAIGVPTVDEVAGQTVTGRDLHKMGVLELPKDKRYSLADIQGSGTGQIHQINKTRTIIGRTGADLNLDDAEASRQHAAVEILGENAVLRDLGSTNGTFIELDRIQQHVLNNHMEFRIGSHVLMFIVTDVE
jgi:predicted Zn finger-like uncharacterized protein